MKNHNVKQVVQTTIYAWLVMISVDFLIHASILAPLYAKPSPFLLSPEKAFLLIPLGYISFFVLAILLVWLIIRLNLFTRKEGFLFGLKLGGLIWGSVSLGLLSISTAEPILMLGWFLGQSAELGIVGYVIGLNFSESKPRKLGLWGTIFFIFSIFVGVLIQNI